MDIAIKEYGKHQDEDAQGRLPVVKEQRAWHQMNQSSKVEHQEDDHQIKHNEYRRGAHLIEYLSHRQRIMIGLPSQAEEEQQETPHQQDHGYRLPKSRKGENGPYMPSDIDDCQQGQNHKDKHPHRSHT